MDRAPPRETFAPLCNKRSAHEDISPAAKKMATHVEDPAHNPAHKGTTAVSDGTDQYSLVQKHTTTSSLLAGYRGRGCHEQPSFLSLPAEIRNEIYRYYMPRRPIIINEGDSEEDWIRKFPGLLWTCKQIHAEARWMFYKTSLFTIKPRNWDGDLCHRFWLFINKHEGHMPIRALVLPQVWTNAWSKLILWLKHYHAGQSYRPWGCGHCYNLFSEHDKVISKAFTFVRVNKDLPWAEVEELLEPAHVEIWNLRHLLQGSHHARTQAAADRAFMSQGGYYL